MVGRYVRYIAMGLVLGSGACGTTMESSGAPQASAHAAPPEVLQPESALTVVPPSEAAAKMLAAAEKYIGEPYVFGGRLERSGCRRGGRSVTCQPGIDCQSLIFFAMEDTTGRSWRRFSVMPTVSVARGELGQPVAGLNGVLREDLDPSMLSPGDVLFFLMEDYNLENDGPLHTVGEQRYGTWHTGLFHGVKDGKYRVLHAAPGERVRKQALSDIPFDALFVTRME